jgi:hypothetical protein
MSTTFNLKDHFELGLGWDARLLVYHSQRTVFGSGLRFSTNQSDLNCQGLSRLMKRNWYTRLLQCLRLYQAQRHIPPRVSSSSPSDVYPSNIRPHSILAQRINTIVHFKTLGVTLTRNIDFGIRRNIILDGFIYRNPTQETRHIGGVRE